MFKSTLKISITAAICAVTMTACAYAAEHTVMIKGMKFEPASLQIAAGDTVTFINQDGAPHTATANSGAFETPRLGRGQSAAFTFSAKGRYDYFCAIHPRMKAVLVVN